jgi:hypothetical protein
MVVMIQINLGLMQQFRILKSKIDNFGQFVIWNSLFRFYKIFKVCFLDKLQSAILLLGLESEIKNCFWAALFFNQSAIGKNLGAFSMSQSQSTKNCLSDGYLISNADLSQQFWYRGVVETIIT